MTPAEALRAAGQAGDEAAVRDLLSELSETQQTDLMPIVRELVASDVRQGIAAVGHLGPMLLAAYGTLPVSEIRKLGWRTNHLPDGLEVVLRRRSPDRLGPIIEYLLDEAGGRAWPIVRALVREGTISRPDRPSYTIAMLAATRYRRAADLVADDPGLLDVEAWRLFEVEGGGEDSLANHEKFFGDSWGDLFRELAATDPATRQRLLDASLMALARDFSAYRAGWFSRFHESLAPTDVERIERAEAYLRLLRSRIGPTVSFAIVALGRISRDGRLPPGFLLDRIGPVLVQGPAGTAKAALDIVGRVGAGTPDAARRVAVTASDGLANASPDVQRAAIALIGRLVAEPDDAVARAITERLPDVAESQRPATIALLARLGGAGASQPAAHRPAAVISAPATTIRQSPIDPARAIVPLTSFDALVDTAVSVLETGGPPDDLERVLDAVGRYAGEQPAGVSRLAAPIARRARTILGRRESSPFNGFDPRADIAAVLLALVTGELVDPGPTRSSDPGAGAFLSVRAREVAEAAARRLPFISIAAPTHTGGWIAPMVLVERLASRPPASRLDLVAAILRLAPGGRDDAMRAAVGLCGEWGAVTRYALGGDEAIGPTAAWWVAAARVRAPGLDDTAVEKRHPRLGPDAGQAARIGLHMRRPATSFMGLSLEIEPAATRDPVVDLPTVLMLREASPSFWTVRSDASMLRWMATIQPGFRETWAAVGCLSIARNVDWWSAEWANRAFLEPFIDPVTTIGPHAQALIGLALGAREAGERGLATDVVRLALADGRTTASDVAEGLTAAAAVSCDRPIRWAVSLADVASYSSGHATAVGEAIARSLAAIVDRPPGKLVPLLRLLDELLAGTGTPVTTDGRPCLERLAGGSGQAGRLARSILSRG